VVLTAHYYDQWVANRYLPYLAKVITHNPDLPRDEKHVYLVQGCPVFEAQDRQVMRKKYGLPREGILIGSFGFIAPWKQIDYFFCGYLAPLLAKRRDVFVQLLHSGYPKSPGLTARTMENIQDSIREFGIYDQVFTCWEYLEKDEINERLQALDVGYIWGRAESKGSSAVTKEFIAARCPLIVPESPHYADLTQGLVKVPPGDASVFLKWLMDVAEDEALLERLQREQRQNYERYNYQRVAEEHRKVYDTCLTESR